MDTRTIVEANKHAYQDLYTKSKLFVRYPMDQVIRFHAYYLKHNIPRGRLLDYGCGSGNNSLFFIQEGYDVYGVDVAEAALDQIKENFEMYSLDMRHLEKFQVIPPDATTLAFEDRFFDIIVSNQVLYYLGTEEGIQNICRELERCLRPGGLVFFTMLGARNYYFTHHTKRIHGGETCEVVIEDPSHRLYGLREMIYVVRDEDHLRRLFSNFECVNVGYFDMSMFDMKGSFHWIFVGRKPA
jgi:SAM-dependent methyltransferase